MLNLQVSKPSNPCAGIRRSNMLLCHSGCTSLLGQVDCWNPMVVRMFLQERLARHDCHENHSCVRNTWIFQLCEISAFGVLLMDANAKMPFTVRRSRCVCHSSLSFGRLSGLHLHAGETAEERRRTATKPSEPSKQSMVMPSGSLLPVLSQPGAAQGKLSSMAPRVVSVVSVASRCQRSGVQTPPISPGDFFELMLLRSKALHARHQLLPAALLLLCLCSLLLGC